MIVPPRADPGCDQFWEDAYERFYRRKFSDRRFRAAFGGSPSACAQVWIVLREAGATPSSAERLLWALNFLKEYGLVENASAFFGVSQPTYHSAVSAMLDTMLEHLQFVRALRPLQHHRFRYLRILLTKYHRNR